MISLCSVVLNSNINATSIMLESLCLTNSGLIDEVVIVDINPKEDIQSRIGSVCSIQHTVVPLPINHVERNGHAIGLHKAMDVAKNRYLFLCDGDVIYVMNHFDRFFMDVYTKYDLLFAGINHCTVPWQAFLQFPTVQAMLVDREKLPTKTFLEGKLAFDCSCRRPHIGSNDADGFYLLYGPIEEYRSCFPFVDGIFDVGCNLFLWAMETNGKWMSFVGRHAFYYTKNVNNFCLNESFGNQRILYHLSKGARNPGQLRVFKRVWKYVRNEITKMRVLEDPICK